MARIDPNGSPNRNAYIITGPTSGIGRATALELSKHGDLILVGRNRQKLDELQGILRREGRRAVTVTCDLSDIASVHRAAAEIAALRLPIAGLLNNAGIMETRPTRNAVGWDMSFVTNYLGPFALTEALAPNLPDGADVLSVVSALEDPERKPAVAAGFRGGRYISAEASARGEWQAGGAKRPGFDAYATSKQALLAATMAFARENPRLRFNAIEPGFNPTTGLGGGDVGAFVRFLQKYVIPLIVPMIMPFMNILSTPQRAARVITGILTDPSGKTGIYYDEAGRPMQCSEIAHDQAFQDRVVTETRALLSQIPTAA